MEAVRGNDGEGGGGGGEGEVEVEKAKEWRIRKSEGREGDRRKGGKNGWEMVTIGTVIILGENLSYE